ncbi:MULTISPECIES: DUF3046 domain-containing protein [Kocuria]|uniref:DUF3046 domain-containing protein n=1 Tax=Kocuria subflava TaxID=1736139 RepID=A0A846TVH2_9MICC|nr:MULTISPECIES: DUF3046 domain-containing protein [unclassified Kocuria]NKE09714.1 DUF3046 domain-containing protein [Kocuria subflava]
MRLSRFYQMLEHEFGAGQGRMLVQDTVLGELGHRTPEQALNQGEDPKTVWFALCKNQDVPRERWWGPDMEPKR